MTQILTIQDAIRKGQYYLQQKGISGARLDAELLLAHCLSSGRLDLYLRLDKPLEESEKSCYRGLLRRRAEHEPVAYITGKKEFWSMEFKVDGSVLIPRPETEILVEQALKKTLALHEEFARELALYDLGTGCGAVAVALSAELKKRQESIKGLKFKMIASDISEEALKIARLNASELITEGKIEFRQGSFFECNDDKIDLIVTNPPYVAVSERETLSQEIRDWEPGEAIFGGEDGLEVIRGICRESPKCLNSGGFLLTEVGCGQHEKVKEILLSTPYFYNIEFYQDYGKIVRVVCAQRK